MLTDIFTTISDLLWHEYVLYFIMAVGVLFTLWSGFCQFRALTHGVSIIRGRYDHKNDPGAINHFQALSAALSATVGLGNIGGVATAIALGGPGAVFWMWIIGFIGMALKTTEVSLAMLYRNTDDPDNPHGGAMWVADRGFAEMSPKLKTFGKVIGFIFCITLLISSITGGNMFQAWNVAEVTQRNFEFPRLYSGIILAVLCGLVTIGGIKSIGRVAGILVPFMCLTFLLAGLFVIFLNITKVPEMFALIVNSAFGQSQAQGAFLGGTVGYAFTWGMKRALFSNEAGQGSAPIAHAAAKTDEPIREGVVAGLEPFIDTIMVCTVTALIILSSDAWIREPDVFLPRSVLTEEMIVVKQDEDSQKWKLEIAPTPLPDRIVQSWHDGDWKVNTTVFLFVDANTNVNSNQNLHRIDGKTELNSDTGKYVVKWNSAEFSAKPNIPVNSEGVAVFVDYAGAALTSHAFDRVAPGLGRYMVPMASWLFALSTVISWSYYGEQGIVYMFGNMWVMPYRLIYCCFLAVATMGFINTDADLDLYTSIGTGVMLVANLPICLVFGYKTMSAYHAYMRRLKNNEFHKNW